MMRAGTTIPQSLQVETEPYSPGWEIIKNSDGNSVDRDLRRADWNFFFLAASIQATAIGYVGARTVRRAMERVLAKEARAPPRSRMVLQLFLALCRLCQT